jgi:hypothetical protein
VLASVLQVTTSSVSLSLTTPVHSRNTTGSEDFSGSSVLTPIAQSGYATPMMGDHPRAILSGIPDPDSATSASDSLSNSIASLNISTIYSSDYDDDDDDEEEEEEEEEKESSDEEQTQLLAPKCLGVIVEWQPGSIWNTYPYHQHAEWVMDWSPIGIEDNGSLRLRSKTCSINLDAKHMPTLTCASCQYIPNSVKFKKFMTRAVEAQERTPWAYLNFQQLSNRMHKLTDQNRLLKLKVLPTILIELCI